MKTVISKLQASVAYTEHICDNARRVVVPGHTTHLPGFLAPTSTSCEVSDEDAAWLAKHPHFIEHQKRGFVKIVENRDSD